MNFDIEYNIRLYNKDGELVKEIGPFHNLVVNQCIAALVDKTLGTGANNWSRYFMKCAVGTNNTAPTIGDTALGTEVSRVSYYTQTIPADIDTTLAVGCASGDTTLVLSSTANFPDPIWITSGLGIALLGNPVTEIITYEILLNNGFDNVNRGQGNTTAQAHGLGTRVRSGDPFLKYTYVFNFDEGNGNLKEIGLAKDTDSTLIRTRSLIRDSEGNAITVVKTSAETMTITARIRVSAPIT